MRALLPHLRLLTLSPEAEDVLHSFLTTEEQLHVLHFNMFKTFRTNFPDTLNTKTVERTPSKLTECRVNFIPDESVSKNFEHLKEEDVFIWYWSQRSCQKNVVTLTANTDIYLTGFECLGSFPANRNSNLKYNKVTRSFQLQPDCTPLPMHILKTSFSISPPYYKIPSVVRYRERKFGYLNIFDSAQFIPKGLPLTLEITMLGGDLNWVSRRFWQIKDSTVNEFLRVNGCQDFGQIQVVQCGISPVFIKNIRYIKVDETQK
jgi:hypothetical protein